MMMRRRRRKRELMVSEVGPSNSEQAKSAKEKGDGARRAAMLRTETRTLPGGLRLFLLFVFLVFVLVIGIVHQTDQRGLTDKTLAHTRRNVHFVP